MEIIYLDTEYSGFYSALRHKSGELLQLSAIAVRDGVEVSRFNEMLRPLTNFWNKEAEKVHGISQQKAKTQRDPELVLHDFMNWIWSLGDEYWTIKGFNCSCDKLYIDRLLIDYDKFNSFYNITRPQWLDVIGDVKEKNEYISTKKHTLESLCNHFGVEINSHDALWDAWATWKIDEKLKTIELPNSNHVSMNLYGLTKKEKVHRFINASFFQTGSDGSIYISDTATKNKEAMRIIIEHIWNMYC